MVNNHSVLDILTGPEKQFSQIPRKNSNYTLPSKVLINSSCWLLGTRYWLKRNQQQATINIG
jgi:hypothetical protein